jgi:hypothetical protein
MTDENTEKEVEKVRESYRYAIVVVLTVIGLLFSLSQVCALFPIVIDNAQSVFHFQESVSNWIKLFSNTVFLISCMCSSTILILFVIALSGIGQLQIWIMQLIDIAAKKGFFAAVKQMLIKFWNKITRRKVAEDNTASNSN